MRKPKGKRSIWRGIYNPDKNYILGRTPRNWGSLLIFYTIFYTILAALFAICMQGLLASLSDEEPRWQLDKSLIGNNPGVGLRPIPDNLDRGSLIWYDAKDKKQVDYWTGLLSQFLQPYTNRTLMVGAGKNQVQCDFDKGPGYGQVCAVNVDKLGPCSESNGFNYNKSAPCIFLKLNKIYNWEPEYYDDINNLPNEMPQDLKDEIKSLPVNQRKQVWVSCNGERSSDEESLRGMKYFPSRGFPGYYYPFKNAPGYLSPLIAVKIERPTLNRIINIECRAWAKNILYNGSLRDRQGSIHFELMVH
ncbi:Sodium/potassium-transporting ATPase subunit beta-1 [Pseudolycoriella hygida]|uniref:Sodium/potassium-transporting ATPase subunit beta-1 n=1 Tax=Pseudolycoriella hygida TaxID=35572 RepID=A0A9Q0NGW9_9DIPT|nr:Sodium/potassium-transporting ATPase subunit beta-1 [Pseudolycoriella hygida]